jgi:hypothetical protein
MLSEEDLLKNLRLSNWRLVLGFDLSAEAGQGATK